MLLIFISKITSFQAKQRCPEFSFESTDIRLRLFDFNTDNEIFDSYKTRDNLAITEDETFRNK